MFTAAENAPVPIPFQEIVEQRLTLGVAELSGRFFVLFSPCLLGRLILSLGAGDSARGGRRLRLDLRALSTFYFAGPGILRRSELRRSA